MEAAKRLDVDMQIALTLKSNGIRLHGEKGDKITKEVINTLLDKNFDPNFFDIIATVVIKLTNAKVSEYNKNVRKKRQK